MLGCGHVYCTKCIATHAWIQRAARRPINCPCCVRPVSFAEQRTLHMYMANERGEHTEWAPLPQQPPTHAALARTLAPSWNDVRAASAASRPAVPAVASAEEAMQEGWPVSLSQREQRTFERAAARLQLRRCPHCDATVQKAGGCDHMTCACGASFSWLQAVPLVGCRTWHHDSNEGWHCCSHCPPAVRAKLKAARVARAAAVAPVVVVAGAIAGATIVAAAGVAVAVAAVPVAVFGPLALVYEPIRRTRSTAGGKKHSNGFAKAAASGAVVASLPLVALFWCGNDSD